MVTKPENTNDTAMQATLYLKAIFPDPFDETQDAGQPELDRILQKFGRKFSEAIVPEWSEPQPAGEQSRILTLFEDLANEAASMGHEIPRAGVVAEARRIFAKNAL